MLDSFGRNIDYMRISITDRAMLSRGVSVIRGGTLIVNLPGSPKAVRESLEYILPHLAHGVGVLRGEASECGGANPRGDMSPA